MTKIRELGNNDRIVFAGTACFLIKLPGKFHENSEKADEIDWEFVQRELMDNMDKENKKMEEIQEKEREFQGLKKSILFFPKIVVFKRKKKSESLKKLTNSSNKKQKFFLKDKEENIRIVLKS